MGIAARGTKLKIGDGGSPESFTTVAEVTSVTVTINGEVVDITNFDSTDDWQENVGTIKSFEVSGEANLLITDNTQDANDGLLNDLDNQTSRNFELVFPDSGSTTWTLPAIPTTWEADLTQDSSADLSFTLTGDGKPTLN